MIVIRFEYDANILLLQRFYCSLSCHYSSHWWHAKHPSLSDLNMTQDVMNLLIIQKLLQPIGGGLLLTDSSSPTTTSHPHLPPFTPPHPPSPSTLPATHTIVLLWLLRLIPASHNPRGIRSVPMCAPHKNSTNHLLLLIAPHVYTLPARGAGAFSRGASMTTK